AYSRPKGHKTINRIRLDINDLSITHNKNLQKYKYLFSVDTNTDPVRCVSVSVFVAVLDIIIDNVKWNVKITRQDAFEFRNCSEPPEKIGWCEFCAHISNANLAGPIGLIVDAHLNDLSKINSRDQPICKGYFLPLDMEFIYASSDAGTV